MKKITVFAYLLVFTTIVLRAQESVGLISSVPESVPAEVAKWGKLVGNWDIIVEMIGEDGNVAQSFDAEWNWFYIMNGLAIQDVFILPKRAENIEPSNYFIGTGIRIYDENSKTWQTSWIDTSTKRIELREAISTDQDIVIIHHTSDGDKLRYTYYDINDESFKWKQESADEGGSWKVTQTVVAKRRG